MLKVFVVLPLLTTFSNSTVEFETTWVAWRDEMFRLVMLGSCAAKFL